MPKFFFTTSDSDRIDVDQVGVVFPDLYEAAEAAQRTLADIAKRHSPTQPKAAFSVKVENESGEAIYRASLSLAAAMQQNGAAPTTLAAALEGLDGVEDAPRRHPATRPTGIDVQGTLQRAGVVGLWDYRVEEGLVYSDPAMARLYGVDPIKAGAGLSPEAFRNAIHVEDRDMAIGMLHQAVQNGKEYRSRYRIVADDGSARLIEARAKPLRLAGKTVSLSGINTEITSVPRLTDALADLAELSAKAAALAATLDDRELMFFSQMLLMLAAKKLAGRPKETPFN